QLADVVALERTLPDGSAVRMYGVVTQIAARHEGAHFDSDVFLIESGVLPAEVSEVAAVSATRFEPEIFVPPLPGSHVRIAQGLERDQALFFDRMRQKVPVGLGHDEQPLYANLEFIDGTRGAHINISGISGVATKTSCSSTATTWTWIRRKRRATSCSGWSRKRSAASRSSLPRRSTPPAPCPTSRRARRA